MTREGAAIAICVASLAAGCDARLPQLVATTEHVALYSDRDLRPGLAQWLEAAWVADAAFFGVSGGHGMSYYDLGDAPTAEARCGLPEAMSPVIAGCTEGFSVYTSDRYHSHEIIHAVAHNLGTPPRWMAEGIAEALSMRGQGLVAPDARVRDWLEDGGFTAGGWPAERARYAPAASLTRFILEREGRTAYLRFYAAVAADSSLDAQRATFASITGEPLDTALDAWVVAGSRSLTEISSPPPECELASSTPGRSAWSLTPAPCLSFNCDSTDWHLTSIAAPTPARIAWTVMPGPIHPLQLQGFGCGVRSGTLGIAPATGTTSLSVVDVAPGTYVLAASTPESDSGTEVGVDFDVEPLSDCAPLPIALDGLDSIELRPAFTWPDDACPDCHAWYALTAAAATTLTLEADIVVGEPQDGLGAAFVCPMSCSDLGACAAVPLVDGRATIAIAAGSTQYVMIEPAGPAHRFALTGWLSRP